MLVKLDTQSVASTFQATQNEKSRKMAALPLPQTSSSTSLEGRVRAQSDLEKDVAAFLREPAEAFLAEGVYISNLDFLKILFELMKLDIFWNTLEKTFRKEEREAMIKNFEAVVANLETQGNFQLVSGILTFAMGMVGAVAPVVGHTNGESILGKLKEFFPSLEGLTSIKFFTMVSKTCHVMSELNKATGQIHSTSAESKRTRFQYQGEINKTDENERSRLLDELRNSFRELMNVFIEILREAREAARASR